MTNLKSSWRYLIITVIGALPVGIMLMNVYSNTALAAFNQTSSNNNSNNTNSINPPSADPKNAVSNNSATTTPSPSVIAVLPSTGTTNNTTVQPVSNKTNPDPAKKVPHVIVFNLDKISVNAAKAPNAPVSNATCGQEAGFPIQLNVNGLAPDTTVMWRLVHSNGAKTQGPWGTFETNSTGGFSEPTYMEDLPKDKYHLLFFNSVQDDNFRPSDAVASALVTVASSNSCTP